MSCSPSKFIFRVTTKASAPKSFIVHINALDYAQATVSLKQQYPDLTGYHVVAFQHTYE